MKRFLVLILSLAFCLPVCADDFNITGTESWENYALPDTGEETKPVSDEEFEEALKKIDSKVNKWKNWAENRKKPKGEAFNEANESEQIQNGTNEEKAGDPVICVYMDLKIGENIVPVGHYQVKGEIVDGKPFLSLYQAHYLMAKLPAVETADDFGEDEILFAKFIPQNDNRVKIIYGSLDFNAYTFVDTK
ncbi:hypothetical protein IJ579_03220 [bacterium]|nr:hypothetical protein [bacterium]